MLLFEYMQPSIWREIFSAAIKVLAVIFTFIFILGISDAWYNQRTISDGQCNVAVLPIEGAIMPFRSYDEYALVTTPGQVRSFLSDVSDDDYIKAVLFDINSPGGTPVAAEQISDLISEFDRPSVSVIGDMGASAAYLIAASADTIIASPMSIVGSIGVTMSYVENSKQNEEDGLTFVELSSGKYKDSGDPNKPLNDDERQMFEHDLKTIHDAFVLKIAGLRSKSKEEIEALADGSAMPGSEALGAGLIDELGGRNAAKKYLAEVLGLAEDEIQFCEYQDPIFSL